MRAANNTTFHSDKESSPRQTSFGFSSSLFARGYGQSNTIFDPEPVDNFLAEGWLIAPKFRWQSYRNRPRPERPAWRSSDRN